VDLLTLSPLRVGRRRLGVASIALAATLSAGPAIAAGGVPAGADVAADVAVKAAFLYNFAKFTEWPALTSGGPLVLCVVGGDTIAAALVETVKGQNISGHAIEVWRPQDSSSWQSCHLLFIAESETHKSAGGLAGIKTLPVLTVSDGKDFSQSGGIIELFVESGRMRFAINMDAAESSGLRLSSRLLGLAKVTRNGHGP
jgi:uncharacterized protein DUF4154